MAVTITKPTIGGSEDSWGLILNNTLDNIGDGLNGVTTIEPNLTTGSWKIGGTAVTATAAELNSLDGLSVSTTEINILDGDTSATSTTVVDADRVVFNDNGTMKQVALSDIKTYINASVGTGSVTSVALTAPTGFSVSGSPITSNGTLALTFQSGYSLLTSSQAASISNIPTTTSQLTNNSGFITAASLYTQPTTFGAVGTYAFLVKNGSSVTSGSSVSGSSLQSGGVNAIQNLTVNNNVYNANMTGLARGDTTMSGTWRAMGSVTYNSTSTYGRGTIFLRIS
jgi:hypothetical protein